MTPSTSTSFLDNVPEDKRKLAKAIVKKLRGIVELEKHSTTSPTGDSGPGKALDNTQVEKLKRKSDLISQIGTECGVKGTVIGDYLTAYSVEVGSKSRKRVGEICDGTAMKRQKLDNSNYGTKNGKNGGKNNGKSGKKGIGKSQGKNNGTTSLLQTKLETAYDFSSILTLAADDSLGMNPSIAAHIIHKLGICSEQIAENQNSEQHSSNQSLNQVQFSHSLKRVGNLSSEMNGKQLCKVMYGLGKIVEAKIDEKTMNSAIVSLVHNLCHQGILPALKRDNDKSEKNTFDIRALSTILWGFAKMEECSVKLGDSVHSSESTNSNEQHELQSLLIKALITAFDAFDRSGGSGIDAGIDSGGDSGTDTAMAIWSLAKLGWFVSGSDIVKLRRQVRNVLEIDGQRRMNTKGNGKGDVVNAGKGGKNGGDKGKGKGKVGGKPSSLLKPREISMLAYGCACLLITDVKNTDINTETDPEETRELLTEDLTHLIKSLLQASQRSLTSLEPQGLANILWSVGKILQQISCDVATSESVANAKESNLNLSTLVSATQEFQRALDDLCLLNGYESGGYESESRKLLKGVYDEKGELSPAHPQGVAQVALGTVRICKFVREQGKCKLQLQDSDLLTSVISMVAENLKVEKKAKVSDIGDLARAVGMAVSLLIGGGDVDAAGGLVEAKKTSIKSTKSEVGIHLQMVIAAVKDTIVNKINEIENLKDDSMNETERKTIHDSDPLTWQCLGHLEFLVREGEKFVSVNLQLKSKECLHSVLGSLRKDVLASSTAMEVLKQVEERRNIKCQEVLTSLAEVYRKQVDKQVCQSNKSSCSKILLVNDDSTLRKSIIVDSKPNIINDWSRFCRMNSDKQTVIGEVCPSSGGGDGYDTILIRIPAYGKDAAAQTIKMCMHHCSSNSSNNQTTMLIAGHIQEGILSLISILKERFKVVEVVGSEIETVRVLKASGIYGTSGPSPKDLLKKSSSKSEIKVSKFLRRCGSDSSKMNQIGQTSFAWYSYPGLFAGGSLTEMTKYFLNNIPTLTTVSDTTSSDKTSSSDISLDVLDLCCGSGCIGGAVIGGHLQNAGRMAINLHSADADAISIKACQKNLKALHKVLSEQKTNKNIGDISLHFHTSNVFDQILSDLKFDLILSNPPVHNGCQPDFSIVEKILEKGRKRLKKQGKMYLVVQEYVPVEGLVRKVCLRKHGDEGKKLYSVVKAIACDGKYCVWELGK